MSAPRVSIVLPTYNRRDALARAIASVRAQSCGDFELIVVDDGSTDGSADAIAGLDPRLVILRQANSGVAGARNAGLAAARGALIAFLDSDDEWTPHHLEVATAFFDEHPGEDAFTSEFWEDFGDQRYVKHFRVETGDWYPRTARRIGSRAFAHAPPDGDAYLWFYRTSSQPGGRVGAALERAGHAGARHYRGDLFRGWRWGWLMALQPTVITRRALDAVGPFDARYRIASDFGWLAQLCRRFPMNLIAAPGCIKHELGAGGAALAEGHLVTGRSAVAFHQDVLRFYEELFLSAHPGDAELTALRGFRQALVAGAALERGERATALAYLREAAQSCPGAELTALRLLAHVPQDRLAAAAFRGLRKATWMAARVKSAFEARP